MIENPDNDGSLSGNEFDAMKVVLYGAMPMKDASGKAYILRMRGEVVASVNTIKQCYYRYKGYPL